MDLTKELTKQLLTEIKDAVKKERTIYSPNTHFTQALDNWHKTNVVKKSLHVNVFHCYLGKYQEDLSSQTRYNSVDKVVKAQVLKYLEKLAKLIEADNLKLVKFDPSESGDVYYYLLPTRKTSKYVKLVNKVLG